MQKPWLLAGWVFHLCQHPLRFRHFLWASCILAWVGAGCGLWLARTPTPRLTTHVGQPGIACFSPDGRYFATAGNVLHLWQTDSGAAYWQGQSPSPITGFVRISADAKHVAAQIRGCICVWDTATRQVDTLGDYDTWTAALAPDGKTVATAQTGSDGAPGAIKVRDLASGAILAAFPDMEPWPNSLFFSPDGRYLAFKDSGAGGKPIILLDWQTKTRKICQGAVTDVEITFSPDGQTIAGGLGGAVGLWDTATLQQRAIHPLPGLDRARAFSPDGRLLAVSWEEPGLEVTKAEPGYWLSLREGHTVVLDVQTGKRRASLPFSRHLAFRSDGTLVTYSADQAAILIWDVPPAIRLDWSVLWPPLLVAVLFTMCAWLAGRRQRMARVPSSPTMS